MEMTAELREQLRQDRLNEAGTEPPCPFCQKPRVKRSDYIRCNSCGVNWLDGEDISKNPAIERKALWMATLPIKPTNQGNNPGAPPAGATSDEPPSR